MVQCVVLLLHSAEPTSPSLTCVPCVHREKQAANLERRAELAAGGGLPRGRPPLVQPERPEREDARLPGAEVPPPPWLPAGSGLLPPALLASTLPSSPAGCQG